ncbi:hypothetical protein F7R91_35130 [Streptomyces luteolifulvus]|jgi:hypothetical protein|uniref:Uncharacterized protein n=1 Tax=Streptomyces luteolifulvus TaxID=2615112 RepID=A0A6H9UQ66_9ACTN|nr:MULTISPECIES: hypothetical protein [Streptomyces]KAB1140686.1 hypothetical protein F7R91_35130 [Streptomyces luteolifulvus]MXM66840.1 hypothetical protein [Streptomyces sp. HUCO-GS316]
MSYPRRSVAARDWFTRARVRILEEHRSTSVEPLAIRIFRPGEEVQMVQWGPAGLEPETDMWLTSTDISAAHIIPADKVDVLEVLEAQSPEDDA